MIRPTHVHAALSLVFFPPLHALTVNSCIYVLGKYSRLQVRNCFDKMSPLTTYRSYSSTSATSNSPIFFSGTCETFYEVCAKPDPRIQPSEIT